MGNREEGRSLQSGADTNVNTVDSDRAIDKSKLDVEVTEEIVTTTTSTTPLVTVPAFVVYPSAVLDKDEDEETEESLGEITTVTTFPEDNHKDYISDSSNEEEVNEEVSANLLEELDHDTTTIESVNS